MPFETASSHAQECNGVNGRKRPLWAGVKEVCGKAAAGAVYYGGLLRATKRLARSYELRSTAGSRVPRLRKSGGAKFGILCYHRVGTEGVPLFSRLNPGVFEAQMCHVKKHYRIVPLAQLCAELEEGRWVEPTLAITFDDGYRDLYNYAFPVLQKYSAPATIYLIGRSMETGEAPWYDRIFVALEVARGPVLEMDLGARRQFLLTSAEARTKAAWEIVCYLRSISDVERRKWCAEFETLIRVPSEKIEGRMLDWNQVRIMQRNGVSLGAHTMTHPFVSQLHPGAFEEELGRSKQLLERGLGAPVEDFAYPFGKPEDCSLAGEQFLRRCGYRSAVTTKDGFNTQGTNILRLRRLQVSDDPSLAGFAWSVNRMFMEGPAGDGAESWGRQGSVPVDEEKKILKAQDA